jgi:hypothetical protein
MHAMPAQRGGAPGMSWGGSYRSAVYGSQSAPRPGRNGGYGGYGGGYGPAPVRVADQGGRHERGGERAPNQWQGQVQPAPHRDYGGGYGMPFGGYPGNMRGNARENPITQVSAETRQVPHPPADSPVRAGSIREDVARYNEERSSFRQYPRNGGEVPRPPMPSPYRN